MTTVIESAKQLLCKGIKFIHQVREKMPDIQQVLDMSRWGPIELADLKLQIEETTGGDHLS